MALLITYCYESYGRRNDIKGDFNTKPKKEIFQENNYRNINQLSDTFQNDQLMSSKDKINKRGFNNFNSNNNPHQNDDLYNRDQLMSFKNSYEDSTNSLLKENNRKTKNKLSQSNTIEIDSMLIQNMDELENFIQQKIQHQPLDKIKHVNFSFIKKQESSSKKNIVMYNGNLINESNPLLENKSLYIFSTKINKNLIKFIDKNKISDIYIYCCEINKINLLDLLNQLWQCNKNIYIDMLNIVNY